MRTYLEVEKPDGNIDGEDGDKFTDIPEDRVEIVTKMLKHGRE